MVWTILLEQLNRESGNPHVQSLELDQARHLAGIDVWDTAADYKGWSALSSPDSLNIMPVLRIFDGVFSVHTSAVNFCKLLAGPEFEKVSGKYFAGSKQKRSSEDSYNEQNSLASYLGITQSSLSRIRKNISC